MDIYWRKIKWICTACIVAVSISIGCWYVQTHSYHLLQTVSQLGETREYIYGKDENSENYYLFRIRKEGDSQEFFSVPKEQNGNRISLYDLWADKEGNVYVYKIESNDIDSSQNISMCNFQSGILEGKWNLDDIEEKAGQIYFDCITTEDGHLYVAFINDVLLSLYEMKESGKLEFFKHIPMPDDFYKILVDNKLELWMADSGGNIYRIKDNGEEELFFKNNGSQIDIDNYIYNFQDDVIHIWSISEDQSYEISTAENTGELIPCTEHEDYSHSVRVCESEDDRYIICMGKEDPQYIDRLNRENGWKIKIFLKVAGICLLIGLGYFLLFLLFQRVRGGAPLWGNMILLMIPVIAVGYGILFQMIDHYIDSSFENTKAVKLAREARDFAMDIDMEQFMEKRSSAIQSETDGQELALNSGYLQIYWEGKDGEATERIRKENGMPHLYFYEDGEITSADSQLQMNIPLDNLLPVTLIQGMYTAAEEKEEVYVRCENGAEDYSSVLMPLEDKEGNVIGLLEVWEYNQNDVLENINNKKKIKQQIAATGLGLLAVVLMVMWLNMVPLGRLKSAVLSLTEGKLDSRVRIRGKSEIAGIAHSFNKMAEKVESQVQEMESLEKKYTAFLPEDMFRLFGKKGIQGVKPGEQREIRAAVLAVNTKYLTGRTGVSRGDMFSYINRCLEVEIPVIKAGGGIIFRFFEAGTESLFTGGREKEALDGAVAIVQKSRKLSEEFHMYGGIAEEKIKLAILGSEKRCTAQVLGEEKSLSWFLQKLAEECRADVLITAQAAEKIENFRTEYSSRILGYIHITDQDRLEMIYEVLTGGNEQSRRKKIMTEDEFEDGVRCFMAGRIQDARRHFIKVIDANKEDGAARKYICLCEEQMEKGQGENALCLKKY